MSKIFVILLLFSAIFFTACEEKLKPVVIIDPALTIPISCMHLDTLDVEPEMIETLNDLYPFDKACEFTLSVSYKKDIACNSSYNVQMKSVGRFPKSFLKLEVRKGLQQHYSYYVDLYNNVDEEDVEEGFLRLKRDLIEERVK